jgi:hypothetical protein
MNLENTRNSVDGRTGDTVCLNKVNLRTIGRKEIVPDGSC